jgi:quinol monooxygenase YgiN
MFARVLTLQIRLEKRKELAQKALSQILPLLQKAEGIVQVLVLRDDKDVDKLKILSTWQTREDIEHYHERNYERVLELLRPFVTFPPFVNVYRVDETATLLLSTLPLNVGPTVQGLTPSEPASA